VSVKVLARARALFRLSYKSPTPHNLPPFPRQQTKSAANRLHAHRSIPSDVPFTRNQGNQHTAVRSLASSLRAGFARYHPAHTRQAASSLFPSAAGFLVLGGKAGGLWDLLWLALVCVDGLTSGSSDLRARELRRAD